MNSHKALDIDRIEAAREHSRIGKKVVVFQSTSSTNDIAWEYSNNPDNHGLCVLAEGQTAGRGRRGRTWLSDPEQSVLCSILLNRSNIEAEMLTLAAAVATAEAIGRHGQAELDRATQAQCRIKWPNDVLIREQKVAGILVEKRIVNGRPCFVVGIGINCNQSRASFKKYDLNIPATSLAIETEHQINRTALVCELLEQLEQWLDKANRPSPVIDRWLELSGMLGRHITVECDGRQYSGFCRGVDPAEGLILQIDNSLVRMFGAAQTSVAYEQ